MTRHAEVVAISQAQKALGTVSLDDCTIYVSAEPCAYCCYAIRESRIARVVYALSSPHMGGVSKWPVLTDRGISDTMPDVFDDPPDIVAGFMAQEAEEALLKWNPLIAGAIKARGLFVAGPQRAIGPTRARKTLRSRAMSLLRWAVFDRFGRVTHDPEVGTGFRTRSCAKKSSHRGPPGPGDLAERDREHAADQAEEDPDREIDLFLGLAHHPAELGRAAAEHRAHEQDHRDGGGEQRDELQQHGRHDRA